MNLSGEPVDTPVTYQVVEMEEQKDGQEKEGRKALKWSKRETIYM